MSGLPVCVALDILLKKGLLGQSDEVNFDEGYCVFTIRGVCLYHLTQPCFEIGLLKIWSRIIFWDFRPPAALLVPNPHKLPSFSKKLANHLPPPQYRHHMHRSICPLYFTRFVGWRKCIKTVQRFAFIQKSALFWEKQSGSKPVDSATPQ